MRLLRPFMRVRLKIHAKMKALTVPSRYMESMMSARVRADTSPAGSMAEIMSAYTGSRAEQLARGVMRMVMMRSFNPAMVRVAMMPGTAQA